MTYPFDDDDTLGLRAAAFTELQRIRRRQARERAELAERHDREVNAHLARALLASPPAGNMEGLLRPGEAQKEFSLSKSTLWRIGEKHLRDNAVGQGLCFVDERGRRFYNSARLAAHLERHPPKRRKN